MSLCLHILRHSCEDGMSFPLMNFFWHQLSRYSRGVSVLRMLAARGLNIETLCVAAFQWLPVPTICWPVSFCYNQPKKINSHYFSLSYWNRNTEHTVKIKNIWFQSLKLKSLHIKTLIFIMLRILVGTLWNWKALIWPLYDKGLIDEVLPSLQRTSEAGLLGSWSTPWPKPFLPCYSILPHGHC